MADDQTGPPRATGVAVGSPVAYDAYDLLKRDYLPILSDQCPQFWNVGYHLSIVMDDDFANGVEAYRSN